METETKQLDGNFFTIPFSVSAGGEVFHETTIDLYTLMKHMAAGGIAGMLCSYWGYKTIDNFFVPALVRNAPLDDTRVVNDIDADCRASANAFLAAVEKINAYYEEYDKEMRLANAGGYPDEVPSFRALLIEAIKHAKHTIGG